MGTIRKRGDKWSYRVDLGAVNGKRVQKEKGGFATKKEAAAAMTLVENELLRTGEYVEAEQKITMQQLYEEFIEEEAPLTRKYTTIVRYKSLYRNQIEPEFASNYLYQITTERIQKFINYKVKEEKNKMSGHSEQGLSAAYVRSVYNFLLVLFALAKKKKYIKNNMSAVSEEIVTADTPVPFSAKELIEYLENQNILEVDTGEVYKSGDSKGQAKTKKGQYYDKLTNLITRLRTKMDDRKYGFVFNEEDTTQADYLNQFAARIMGNDKYRIKVIDLSEVPSDMLAIIIGIVTRIIYDIQFWMTPAKDEVRHPLVLVCDEAHIYMSNDMSKMKAVEKKSLEIFEKIAKEGRKYGIGLLIVSQRPAELNTTIMSQCNNIVSLKITNDRDKSAVAAMLTDSLVGIVEMLPNLDVGECVVVGDAIMLPSKIILDKPKEKPKSATIDFWDRWYDGKQTVFDIDKATLNLIKQSRG